MRDGKVLVVRRARKPALNLYTLPGGGVETGETLARRSCARCARRPRSTVEPVALAGDREVIVRDAQGRIERHFVILSFAARWLAGEPVLNEELDDARWLYSGGACPACAPPRAWPRSSRGGHRASIGKA